MIATDFDAVDLTCKIGDLTHAVNVEWEDYNKATITEDIVGYTIDQGTVNHSHVQISTLTISAEKLKAIIEEQGLNTDWACKVQSIRFPKSRQERKDLNIEYLLIGEKFN